MQQLYAEISVRYCLGKWEIGNYTPAFLEMTGLEEEEIKKLPLGLLSLFQPEEAARVETALEKRTKGEQLRTELYNIHKKNGEGIWITLHFLMTEEEGFRLAVCNFTSCFQQVKDNKRLDGYLKRDQVSLDWMLEESNDIVYISDIHTYDMLYMNRGAQEMFKTGDNSYYGRKCYELLHGYDSPCEFCNNDRLSTDSFYTWEHRNRLIGHYFILKDRIIDWGGVPARIEFASDVTAMDTRNQMLQNQVTLDQTIIASLRELNSDRSFEPAVKRCLGRIGAFYQADRAFIIQKDWETEKKTMHYEWCREDFAPMVLSEDEWDYYIKAISGSFDSREAFIVDDISHLKEKDSRLYNMLQKNHVKFKRIVPFSVDGKETGFIGIDNPALFKDELTLLETLGNFIAEEIYRKQMSDKLFYLGYHDALTGLRNRNSYVNYIENIKKAKINSFGVAVADLNSLGEVNRIRGHADGDILVKKTADLLRESFSGSAVFRMSGDEFIIYTVNMEKKEFLERVQYIYNGISELNAYGISIGYAWAEGEADIDIDKLTKQANDRLMISKQNYYSSAKTDSTIGQFRHNRIQQLLHEMESGCFQMYLQVQTDCNTGRIVSAEALARYDSPVYGKYSPIQFIPDMERIFTVRYLDMFIFEEACKTIAKWRGTGQKILPIAVNFSRITIMEPEFVQRLLKIISKYQLSPEYLTVEITETIGDYEDNAIADICNHIKKAGFSLALDDFGSSYTNMAILSIVPADVLKIDRSLISDIRQGNMKWNILKHMLLLCREEGILSVAEGIENAEQMEMMRRLGCDSLQGFYFGRPASVEEFEKSFMDGKGGWQLKTEKMK